MNKWVLMMVGFVFVILMGVVTIMVSEKSNDEIAADISLYSGIKLTEYGEKICQQAIKKEMGSSVYSPTSSEGDRMTTVTLTWEGKKKNYKSIICTYNIDLGVKSLIIDGRVVIEK